MRIKLVFLLLLLVLYFAKIVNVYHMPSTEQQERLFHLEEINLNIKDSNELNEVGREFVRGRTYIVYYSYHGDENNKQQMMRNMCNRFVNSGWRYTGGFEMNDGSLESEFNKEKYICIVIVKDKSVVVKFRYKP